MESGEAPVITKVYRFANDMVMVFDQHGHQMPDYQGRYQDVIAAIRKKAPHVPILLGEVIRSHREEVSDEA